MSATERALITGVRGFTGVHLKRELEDAGYKVYGCVLRAPRSDDEIRADILDPDALNKAVDEVRPNWVVHLAAITFVPHVDAAAVYRTNAAGTTNLLDALVGASDPPERVLIASSANVYGEPQRPLVDESVCPRPINHYAASKLAMEHMARTYCDRLPITITRPFNYTGPGQDPKFLIPKIVEHFLQRKARIELGNIGVVRDFSDVRFITATYRKLLESDVVGETVNVCSGQGVSLQEVLEIMNRISGFEIDVRVNPAFVRSSEIRRLVGSNERLFSLIGPQRTYSMPEILSRMYSLAQESGAGVENRS